MELRERFASTSCALSTKDWQQWREIYNWSRRDIHLDGYHKIRQTPGFTKWCNIASTRAPWATLRGLLA